MIKVDSALHPHENEPPSCQRTLSVVNPATLEVVAEFPAADSADVDHAVRQASTAFGAWSRMSPPDRSRVLWRLADLVEQHHAELAELDVICTGKVIRDAIPEAVRASRHARYWSGMADKLFGQELADIPGRFSFTRREALGVYAVILPWNAPTHGFMARTMPALACGNAVVVKPSELSPLSALRLVELAAEAGVPEGTLGVLLGDGETGAMLSSHPGVDGVSFTGSVNTGRLVAHAGADSFKKVTLELGGKSPIVVFNDADLDSAVRAAVLGIASNAGQICAASSRLLVQKDVAGEFTAMLMERLGQVRVGDPTDPESYVGPVVCQRQYDKVQGMLRSADEGGAKLFAHGEGVTPDLGLYIRPTVVLNPDPDLEIAREEVFGPVLTVTEFTTEDQAIQLANDSSYGLAAFIWTNDVGRMFRTAEALKAGAVHGNSPLVLDPSLPFGGYKDSGIGGAYGGEAVEGCTRLKRVTLRTEASPLPSPWPGV